MNTHKDFIVKKIDDVLSDATYRLDVIYWKNFAIDFNKNSEFQPKQLSKVGYLRQEIVAQQAEKDFYYPFKITYTGNVILKEPIHLHDFDATKFKSAKAGDIVFSRINCCRGAIGIIEEFQNGCICTNETHIFTITDPKVDNRYLHIILRHPYYQDLMLSKSTGASLERMRFHESELLSFEVPIPSYEKQLELIRKVKDHNEVIKGNIESIRRLRIDRNSYILKELDVDLVFSESDEDFYALPISNLQDHIKNPTYRLDFKHNKPSFDMINKLEEGKYPLIRIGSNHPDERILKESIKSGSTPKGGIYPIKGVPFLQGRNIIENGIDLTDHKYITPEFHEQLKRSQLSGNEVLVTIAGTIGRAGVNTSLKRGNINQAIAIIRLSDIMLPLFLSAFLNSDGGQIQFSKFRHDFGTPNINTEELANIRVPLPPLTVQETIVLKIIESERQISHAKEECTKNEKLKTEIITEFLLGKKKYKDILERLK
jgi:restriction endonuclease S subunit